MRYYVGTLEDTFKDNQTTHTLPSALYGSRGNILFIYDDKTNLIKAVDISQPIEAFLTSGSQDLINLEKLLTAIKSILELTNETVL